MAIVKVKNLNGTSKYKTKSGKAWLDEWEEIKKRPASYCWRDGCVKSTDLVGAHVKTLDSGKWYIIPLCKECNAKSSEEIFEVTKEFLVPVSDINS